MPATLIYELVAAAPSQPTGRVTLSGAWFDPGGNPLAGGKLTIRLNTDAKAPTGQAVAGLISEITLDGNGAIPATTLFLWANAGYLTPATTRYIFRVYTGQGQLAWGANDVIIPSTSPTFDISSFIPSIS